jgi:hypothetical protein
MSEITEARRQGSVIPFSELEAMSSYIVRSKLFGAKDESQAMSLMLLAQAEGMHPMSAIQDFDIVQGRPARKTHSILARFQAAGGSVAWEEIIATRACGTFSHPQGGSLRVEWLFEDAKKIGLTAKDNWKNYPKAMLRARCIAEGVRAVFPGAIGGMLSVEEAQDAPISAAGDYIDGDASGAIKPAVAMPKAKPAAATPAPATEPQAGAAPEREPNGNLATVGERNFIKNKLTAAGLEVEEALNENGLSSLDNLTADGFIVMKEYIGKLPA